MVNGISIWVTQSLIANEGSQFVRQSNVMSEWLGHVLIRAWGMQLALNEGMDPADSGPVCLYHVRGGRILSEDQQLGQQGLQDGDTLVLLPGDAAELDSTVVPYLRESVPFPAGVDGDVPPYTTVMSFKELWNHNDRLKAKTDRQMRILFLAAEPTGQAALRLGAEVRDIQQRLKLSAKRDQFKLEARFATRPTDLTEGLVELEPHLVHFSGHGDEDGSICLENAVGGLHPVEPKALAQIFSACGGIDCVILNACHSARQVEALVAVVPTVIAMKQEIADDAAIAFSTGFYLALGSGRGVADAFAIGKAQIGLEAGSGDDIPELFQR